MLLSRSSPSKHPMSKKRSSSPKPATGKRGSSEMVKSLALTDLPPNLLQDILVRLPLKTLLASKCVCKTFLDITTPNTQFCKLHSSKAPQMLVFQFLEGFEHSFLIRILEPELPDFDFRPVFTVPDFKGNEILNPYFNRFALVNSCNGLLYFVRKNTRDEYSFVCNPVTNEYIFMLPDEEELSHSETRSQWLGFDSITNQYKLLRIFKKGAQPMLGAQVYDPRSGSRRNVGKTPLGSGHSWDAGFTFVGGVIYWFDSTQEDIVWFDFDKEMFGVVALPPEPKPVGEQRDKERMSIGVLRGCLAFSYNDMKASRVYIWVMEEHKNQQCWRVEVVVNTGPPKRRSWPPKRRRKRKLLDGKFKPLQILSNGELLMLWVDKDLVCYDPKKKRFRLVGLSPNLNPEAVVFTPSFVSLKDALKIDGVLVQDSRPGTCESDCESDCELDHIRGWKSNFVR